MANQQAKRGEEQHKQGLQRGDGARQPQQGEAPPLSEWVVAALGLLLVAGSIACLAWAAITRSPGDVVPVAQLVSVQPQQGRFLVRVRVENRGRATAEGLKLSGVLRREGQEVERSETELQYLPGHSSREAGLFFSRDPRRFQLELAPESFRVP